MGKTRERKRGEEQGTLWLTVTVDAVRGGVVAAAVSLLVLVAAAGLISAGTLPERLGDSAVIAACLAGGFLGGILPVAHRPASSVFQGIGVGGALFLILLTAGVLMYGAAPAADEAGAILCACLCGGSLSGILGSKPKKKRRR